MNKLFLNIAIFILYCLNTVPASGLCVKASEANMRSGPGLNYDIIWEAYQYTPFEKISKSGDWFEVKDLDGDVRWIHSMLVTDRYECAVVSEDEANIRKGPGTNYEKLFFSPVLKYKTFKVIKKSGAWVKVEDDFGDGGWIFKKLLWIR